MAMSLPGTPFCCAQTAAWPASSSAINQTRNRIFPSIRNRGYALDTAGILLQGSGPGPADSAPVSHSAILAGCEAFAVPRELSVALLLRLAGVQAAGSLEMRVRHRLMVRHVFPQVYRVIFSPLLRGKCSRGE